LGLKKDKMKFGTIALIASLAQANSLESKTTEEISE